MRTIDDYQRRVPLHNYDDFRADIDRMMAGEKNVLVADDVQLFETTGGSTGGSKSLPFTDASLKAIRRAVLPWLDDLITSRPRIPRGKAYWAISPAVRQQSQTSGGIPIGITNDAAYFGADLAQSIGRTLAVPASVASIESLKKPDETQLQLLRRIINRNRDSEFGKRYDFRSVRTIDDYQRRVPLHNYDDFRADIDRMMAGEKNVLVADDVQLFETTGGSTGGSKSLPFTDASLKAIRCAVLPWLDDLITSRPHCENRIACQTAIASLASDTIFAVCAR